MDPLRIVVGLVNGLVQLVNHAIDLLSESRRIFRFGHARLRMLRCTKSGDRAFETEESKHIRTRAHPTTGRRRLEMLKERNPIATIPVRNIDEAKQFYEGKLGLKP